MGVSRCRRSISDQTLLRTREVEEGLEWGRHMGAREEERVAARTASGRRSAMVSEVGYATQRSPPKEVRAEADCSTRSKVTLYGCVQ